MGILSILLFLPLLGAVAIALLPEDDVRGIRATALVASGAALLVAIVVLVRFEVGEAGFQMVEQATWIPRLGISYQVGIDGISLFLVLLTALLTPLVVLQSWEHTHRPKGYFASFLALETGVLGVFLALDLVLFYVFWEAMLVPMFLLIGIWGYERRRYAAVKFFLYTFLGGVLMLVGVITLYVQAGGTTFNYLDIATIQLDPGVQRWLFVTFFAAFAVKVPVFPLHTWLPDAHVEAPTGGSVILAGVLLKLGGYGMLRYSLPLFPDATIEAVPYVLALGVVGVVYGGVVALMQSDLKKLVAYSSVSHMGIVVIGIFALTVEASAGGVVQMINHGLSTSALFLLVGFLYDRRHTRLIADFSGLALRTPVYAGIFLVVVLSSLALPGLNGFVGEFPILLGTFGVHRWAAVGAASGMVLAALYLLWAYQRIFHGPLGAEDADTADLRPREIWVMVPIVALIVAIGLYPRPIYERVEPSVRTIIEVVHDREAPGLAPAARPPTR